MGTIFVNETVSRRRKKLKQVKGGVDRINNQSSCTKTTRITNTRVNVSLSQHNVNVTTTIRTHTQSLTHSYTNRMFWLTFLKSWGTQFGILYGNYTSQCYLYIYIYIQEPYIFLYDLNNPRETIASFLASGKRWNHCHGS